MKGVRRFSWTFSAFAAYIVMICTLQGVCADPIPITGPMVITSPGYYVLENDVTDSPASTFLDIQSSDVIVEGNFHVLGGQKKDWTYGLRVYDTSGCIVNVSVSNLTLKEWHYGMYLRNTSLSRFDNISLLENGQYGIYLQDTASQHLFTSLNASGNANGISAWPSLSGCTFHAFTVTGNSNAGISVTASNCQFIDGKILKNGGRGMFFVTQSPGNLIDSCEVFQNGNGIEYSTNYFHEGNTVRCSTFTQNTGTGCILQGNNSRVYQNTFNGTATTWCSVSGWHSLVEFNTLSDGTGELAVVNGRNNTILNNTILNNTGGILLSNCHESVAMYNRVRTKGASRTGITLTSSGGNFVAQNDLEYNYQGLSLQQSSENQLYSNLLGNQQYYGAYLDTSSRSNLISANNFTGGSRISIFIDRNSDQNNITENTIRDQPMDGITISKSASTRIEKNTIENVSVGISISDSHFTTLLNNSISACTSDGISMLNGSYALVEGNNLMGNDRSGLDCTASSYVNVSRNLILDNRESGVSNSNGLFWDVYGNTVLHNSPNGIVFSGYCQNSTIHGNIIRNHTDSGIRLYTFSNNNSVLNNTVISNGYYGILASGSSKNLISRNNISSNGINGVNLIDSSNDNMVADNILINNNNVAKAGTVSGTILNTTKSGGPNIIGGPFLGGNFWGTPAGTGISQTGLDEDGDGIVDTPYSPQFTGWTDWLPLGGSTPLRVDFSADPNCSGIGLPLQFTDLSVGGACSWAWDFENDGITDSILQNPTFSYQTAGTYSVNLTASNGTAMQSLVKPGYIVILPPPGADFQANPMSGTAPLTVQFTDLSTGNPTSWAWDFEHDGTVDATSQNATHTYYAPGIYSVSLNVSTLGGANTLVRAGYIHVSSQNNGTILIFPGWNFISVPQPLVPGMNAGTLFSAVDTGGRSIWCFDAPTQSWDYLPMQDVLEPMHGYWIYSNSSAPVQISPEFQYGPVSLPSLHLSPGWNAVGIGSGTPCGEHIAFATIAGKWRVALWFNNALQLYMPPVFPGDQTELLPSQGYWVSMHESGDLAALGG